MLNIICGLKEQEDMTTHILEWIKSKNLTISTLAEGNKELLQDNFILKRENSITK